MKKTYPKALLMLALLGLTQAAHAIERPTTPAGAPEDGGQYLLVNANRPDGYMSRASWDGALYFLGASDSHYDQYAFTAQKNEDGTWSFYYAKADTRNYLAIYESGGNLNSNTTEPATWQLEAGDIDGFYKLRAMDGHTNGISGYHLHLNAGNQFFVVNEVLNGQPYYPDYAGGAVSVDFDEENYDPDKYYWKGGDATVMYVLDETGRAQMIDHTSENWAFISVDDLPTHVALYGAYFALQQLTDQIGNDDFTAGLKATLDAATALYESSTGNAEAITAMIAAKRTFRSLIEEAKALENPDATLLAAIDKAMDDFDTKVEADDVTAATEALQAAINAFLQGSGDLTSMGQNMSFEDLTAQGGMQTSSVAGAPVGWEVYVGGKQVVTADDVRGAGISAWHGANDDCEGDPKDGTVGFGLWTSGVPQYEISQQITGLENGTYIIRAGLMVGANGNGSRRTTQRLFGNHNVTYFAAETDYDLSQLDAAEVPAFAGLEEPVTDRLLQEMEVRAYVYDGTLRFGVRTDGNFSAALRSSSNGAGGDGWFKVDNFRIEKAGYDGEDAANVANHYINIFQNFAGEYMQTTLQQEVMAIVDKYNQVDAATPASEINAIITTLSGKIDDVKASIAAYQRFMTAIEEAYLKYDELGDQYTGKSAYLQLIEDSEGQLDEGTLDEAGIDAAIAALNQAYADVLKTGIQVGDYAAIIINPSFEDLSAQGGNNSDGVVNPPAGWTLSLNGQPCATSADYGKAGASLGWCAINSGDGIDEVDEQGEPWSVQYTDGTHLFGIWAANVPEVELSQTFKGLPKGVYVLSCDMVVQYNWGGHCVTTQRIFANDYVQMYGAEATYAEHLNDTEDMTEAMALDAANPDAPYKHMNYAGYVNETAYGVTSCPHHMELTCVVGEDGLLTIGFRTNNVDPDGTAHKYDSAGWFKLDNFQLFYESDEIPTGIASLQHAAAPLANTAYYSLDGRRVSQPARGITIVKHTMSDGSVSAAKVLR
ncbi:MAG: hypothetical protein ILA06_06915 [Bacteroidaceae bacterium]|nr:hypothetical protein [Bacteroidaceae bacterium]